VARDGLVQLPKVLERRAEIGKRFGEVGFDSDHLANQTPLVRRVDPLKRLPQPQRADEAGIAAPTGRLFIQLALLCAARF
jgi:hypothetical protein